MKYQICFNTLLQRVLVRMLYKHTNWKVPLFIKMKRISGTTYDIHRITHVQKGIFDNLVIRGERNFTWRLDVDSGSRAVESVDIYYSEEDSATGILVTLSSCKHVGHRLGVFPAYSGLERRLV